MVHRHVSFLKVVVGGGNLIQIILRSKKKKILIHRALPDATYLLDVSFSYFIILGNSIRAYFYAWKLFYTN